MSVLRSQESRPPGRIETVAARLDEELPALVSSEASVQSRADRYAEVKGRAPSWARGDRRP